MTDWAKLKLEYVNSTISLRDLAEKHGINAAGVIKRCEREGWEVERRQVSADVGKAAQAELGDTRAAELAKFNDDDLKVARGIRAKAASMMATVESPQELSALARAFDTAQKIGRLALGAATESSDHTSSDGSMSPKFTLPTPAEVLAMKKQLDAECE